MFVWVASRRQANVTPIPKGQLSSSVANYRPISITSVLSKLFERQVSVLIGQFKERFGVLPITRFAYRKDLVAVMHFCVCRIHCNVHWRVGRRLGSYRLHSAQPLIGSNIWEFCISTVLWVMEVLCCLYRQFLSNRSQTLWWTVVGVNWLMSCQKCRRAVFWARYYSSYTPQSIFPFWRIS